MEGWDVFLWSMHAAINRAHRTWYRGSVVSMEQAACENITSSCRICFCPFRGLICFPSQCLWRCHPLDKALEELLFRRDGWFCSPLGEPCRGEGFPWAKCSNVEMFEPLQGLDLLILIGNFVCIFRWMISSSSWVPRQQLVLLLKSGPQPFPHL